MTLREISLDAAVAPLHGKRIAVVGNSEDLLTQELGFKIDKRDVVIRMNRGMPGFGGVSTKVTGRKTTILGCGVVSPLAAVFARSIPDHLWWFKLTLSGAMHLHEVTHFNPLDGKNLFMWPSLLEGRLHEELGYAPSSGLRIAYLIKHYARPAAVDFYGYGFWGHASAGKRNWHSKNPAHPAHSAEAEYEYFKKMGYISKGNGLWTAT